MKAMLPALCATLILLPGCGGCGAQPPQDDPPKAPTSAEPVAAALAPGDVDPTSGPPIGIPECDDYFAQAKKCFARNAIMKANMQSGILELRDNIRRQAGNPEVSSRLPEQCRLHAEVLVQDCKL